MRFLLTMIVVFASCVCLAASEINAYIKGTVWETKGGAGDGSGLKRLSKYYFGGTKMIKGKEYLEMRCFSVYENVPDNEYWKSRPHRVDERMGYIRSDEEKIYYVPPGYDKELLLFDFGLKPGDKIELYPYYYPYDEDKSIPEPDSLTCGTPTKMRVGNRTYEIMYVSKPSTKYKFYYSNKWLRGIGSVISPLANIYTNYKGIDERLTKVTVNGEKIYEFIEEN